MWPWFFIAFIVASIITLLSFSKVNLVIKYAKGLKVYYRILFIKIPIYPFKKSKQVKKHSSKTAKKNSSEIDEIREIFEIIDRYKELTQSIFGFYFRALHFKVIKLELLVATKKPSTTALAYSLITQGITYLGEYIQKNSRLVLAKNATIYVNANFLETKSHFKAHFVIYTHLGQLFIVGLVAFFKMIFSLAISFISSLKRRITNGTIKTKWAD